MYHSARMNEYVQSMYRVLCMALLGSMGHLIRAHDIHHGVI